MADLAVRKEFIKFLERQNSSKSSFATNKENFKEAVRRLNSNGKNPPSISPQLHFKIQDVSREVSSFS